MNTGITIDLTNLSEDELLDLYSMYKSANIAHQLWCRRHENIPEHFSIIFVTLLERIKRVTEKNSEGVKTPDVDLDALIDTIYIGCRSMFCENPDLKNNYTLQNCLRKANYHNEARVIDNILQEKKFTDSIMKDESFFSLVKLVSNKSIAHQESLSGKKREKIDYRYKFLNDNSNICEFQYYIFRCHRIYENIVKEYGDTLLNELKIKKQ
ncbi:hypothetical protein ACNA9J_004575 [Salmonella enterica subsp. enterica serovar Infantis]|uniref:hypothetical protein n=1 Tax=Escherichia coli TaxID=562 RepID=UPI0039091E8A